MIARRGILGALVGLVAAPAIIKVANLMPINSGLLLPSGRSLLTININKITRENVRLFKNSNLFLKEMDLQYGDARIDSTLRIRLPNDYITNSRHGSTS